MTSEKIIYDWLSSKRNRQMLPRRSYTTEQKMVLESVATVIAFFEFGDTEDIVYRVNNEFFTVSLKYEEKQPLPRPSRIVGERPNRTMMF